MSYTFPPDVERLVAKQLELGIYSSQDDVLRAALQSLDERNADLEAIREGVADMEAGRVTPIREADAQMRRRLNFPPRA